jgi:uncharacterized protein
VAAVKCPRDQSELVSKVYEADVEIDLCPSCQGAFLDKGELERIQQASERGDEALLSQPDDPVREAFAKARELDTGPIACPRCEQEMIARPYGLGSQIVIDVCPDDCGLWLDGGELQALERFFEQSQQELDLPLIWRIRLALSGIFKGR